MRIENCSQTTFGNVRNSMADLGGDTLIRGIKGKQISKFVAKLDENAKNPVNVDFYVEEGERVSKRKLKADISFNSPYFNFMQTFTKGRFTSTMKFFEKMCKISDKVNAERECAEERYKMFLHKHNIKA